MKLIELTRGKFAIVDDWNYEWLNQFKWRAHWGTHSRWYAARSVGLPNGKQRTQLMHRLIMGDPKVWKSTTLIGRQKADSTTANQT